MSFEYDDPIIHMPRKGTQDSPFRDVEESLIIDNSGKVILNEYPNRFRRVIVTDDKGNNLYEVKSGTPDENGFFVDYSSKTITFNKAHIGKQFHFKYSGEGNSFIPVNSIYTERDGLKVTETLDQLTETTKQARDKANEQASYAKNQGNYAKEQGQKAQDVADNTRYVEPYNDKKLYHKNNIVTHNGNSYMAKKDTIGNEPTGYGDDEYWGLVGFRGQDGVGSVSVKKHTFIATEGQKVFKLPFSYEPLKNRTRVYVGGAPQNTPENYEETNENTITLTEGVRQGTTVYVEVFSTEFDDRIAEFDEKMSHMNNSLDELDGAIQDATTHSEYAKNQGDYAKTQGDYAKEKGEIAQDIADNLEYVEPYNTTKQYKKNNIVTFNGNSFIAKKVNIGNPPPTDLEIETENEYWGLVGRKGDDGTGTVHTIRDEFIATEGQTVFELSKTYDQFQNRTKVIIDGVPQRFPESYDETTPNTITLKEGVYEGAKVVVEYFSKSVPLESDIATTVYNHTNLLNNHTEILNEHENDLNDHTSELQNVSLQLTHLKQHKLSKENLPYIFVDLFGAKGDGITDDTQAIQDAINSIDNQVISEKSALVFRAGGKYRITSTITIDASKVRMLKGYNSYIIIDGDFDGIIYKGNKIFKGTAPDENVNTLKYDEIFNIVQGLQFYGIPDSETGLYRGRGLIIEDQHSPVVADCHFFNLDHGLEIRGMNTRNIVISNTNFWDNRTSGLYFSGGEVHQCVITNCHISYSKYSVYIGEGYKMYNLHISNCDMEAQVGQNEPFRSFLYFLGTNSEILVSNTTLQSHKIEGIIPDNLAYFEKVGRLLLNGCYFAHSYGDGIHIESGSCVIINGCLMENVSGNGIIINNASDVQINSNVFYDIGGSCVKSENGIDRFNIEANRATDVGVYIDIYNNGKSFLDSSISNNQIRPKIAPAIKLESSLNARNLIISNNSIYWATDTYNNPTQYAVDVKVVQASGLIFKNNLLDARSNNSTQGINGFKVKGAGNLYGLILKDNIVNQIRKSAGRVDFDFNDPNNEILISDNLSVRTV
jgi:hypothetical protein